ncbi:TetR family transcriptional regulator [Streptomyces sp. NPDC049954]|uniref:TetR/AcrR family transcriptional regulator n=1 Tax=Streptomyces sp. NPDC049954 TaxID=3155779 RepID=UPI00343C4BDF
MTSGPQVNFQRARSAEQREARKLAILAVAAQLLDELPLSEISLRELSRRVGLSKTNVVRYFETREAVYFELLNREFDSWLAGLAEELRSCAPASAKEVVDVWARSLAARRSLCELLSSLGTELERNISAEAVRSFKLVHQDAQLRLAHLVRGHIPDLTESAARELVSLSIVCTAGLWPFAHPFPAVAEAVRAPELAHHRVDFAQRLGRSLHVAVTGLLALSSRGPAPGA